MDKFTGTKNLDSTSICDITDIQPAKVKMSGYLKKKRNKVGGRRKMWFVLQNQLLLSYSSKEDYDRKLVSFKDALNLVPGTIIRPSGEFRFSIETTSKMIYSFRCDDSKTCKDWITALVESLVMQGKCAKENGLGSKTKFNIFLENIRQQSLKKRTVRSSQSYDSICPRKIVKSPNLPIVQSTAKMLQRNGISTNELCKKNENMSATHNFRLHEKNLMAVIQSDEVCRINQMFSRSTNLLGIRCKKLNEDDDNDDGALVRDSSENNNNTDIATTESRTDNLICGGNFILCNNNNRPHTVEISRIDRDKEIKKFIAGDSVRTGSARDLNLNKMIDDNMELCSFEDQVARLTLNDDESGSDIFYSREHGTAGGDQSKSGSHEKGLEHSNVTKDLILGYSVTQSSTSSSSSTSTVPSPMCSNRRASFYDGSKAQISLRISASSDNINQDEPIYAVVDLKHKYARRAKKMLEMEEEKKDEPDVRKERPKSIHVPVTSDYEEVLNFGDCFSNQEEDENENIYEPIQINGQADRAHLQHRNNLMWRYFPKIRLEALIELTKGKRKDPKLMMQMETQSSFSDIRKKLGNHRKSIKNRMKRLYSRDIPCNVAVKERNAFSDDELDSQGGGATGSSSTSGHSADNSIKSSCGNLEKSSASFVFTEIEKYRRGEKHFFGSLSRLKKARTSLCLEDGVTIGRKKLFDQQKSCPTFQKELKREVSKRSGDVKTLCHSKFYD